MSFTIFTYYRNEYAGDKWLKYRNETKRLTNNIAPRLNYLTIRLPLIVAQLLGALPN